MFRLNEVQVARDLIAILPPSQRSKLIYLAIGLFLVGLLEMVGLSVIFVYISVLDKMSAPAAGGSDLVSSLIAWTGIRDVTSASIWFGLALVIIFMAKAAFVLSVYAAVMRFIYGNFRIVSERLFHGYLNAPYEYYLLRNSFELQRNINVEVPIVFSSTGISLVFLMANVFTVALMLVALFVVQPYVTLFVIVVLGGMTTLFYSVFRGFVHRLGTLRHRNAEGAIKWVSQALDGFREIRVFGRENLFANMYHGNIFGMASSEWRLRTVNQLPSLVNEIILMSAVVTLVVGALVSGQPLSALLPTLAMFGVAGVRIAGMVSSIVGGLQMLQYTSDAVSLIRRELDHVADFASPPEVRGSTLPGDIVFDNAWYSYPSALKASVEGFSCQIKRGSRVAFVGHSGAGKSTVIGLLLGLLRPTKGSARVGDVDISERFFDWRRSLAYVPQTIFLLDDTVRGNLFFGMNEDGLTDADLWEALEIAQLADFVKAQPKGLDTPVGENGLAISGGERQRLGIARALLKRPDVLVLDEATASLDTVTEQRLASAISKVHRSMTLVMVAHRLSTVRDCDEIFYLEGGRVADSGTYDELITSCAGFRAMANVGAPQPA